MTVGRLDSNTSTRFEKATGLTLVSVNGTFGGGTVALEKEVNGTVYPLYDAGAAITLTGPDDLSLALGQDTKIRLTLTGATSPDINWAIKSQK